MIIAENAEGATLKKRMFSLRSLRALRFNAFLIHLCVLCASVCSVVHLYFDEQTPAERGANGRNWRVWSNELGLALFQVSVEDRSAVGADVDAAEDAGVATDAAESAAPFVLVII